MENVSTYITNQNPKSGLGSDATSEKKRARMYKTKETILSKEKVGNWPAGEYTHDDTMRWGRRATTTHPTQQSERASGVQLK